MVSTPAPACDPATTASRSSNMTLPLKLGNLSLNSCGEFSMPLIGKKFDLNTRYIHLALLTPATSYVHKYWKCWTIFVKTISHTSSRFLDYLTDPLENAGFVQESSVSSPVSFHECMEGLCVLRMRLQPVEEG